MSNKADALLHNGFFVALMMAITIGAIVAHGIHSEEAVLCYAFLFVTLPIAGFDIGRAIGRSESATLPQQTA